MRFPRSLYVILIILVFSGAGTSRVHAQTTKFIALGIPEVVLYSNPQPALVTLTISYQDARPGYLLVASLFDDEKRTFLRGTATGWPDPCVLAPELTVNTSCIVRLRATSGQNNVTFGFSTTKNPHALGIWYLRAASALEYADGGIIQDSLYSYRFSVQVVTTTTAKTGATLLSSTTASQTQSSSSESDALLMAIVVIVILFGIGLTYRSRKRRRRSKRRR